jgi:hypothetical protein
LNHISDSLDSKTGPLIASSGVAHFLKTAFVSWVARFVGLPIQIDPQATAKTKATNAQPRPIDFELVVVRVTPGRTQEFVTALYRRWAPGDTAKCRLCRFCVAHNDGCLMVISEGISREDAPLFDVTGLAFDPSAVIPPKPKGGVA